MASLIHCPHCGTRPKEEFTIKGDAPEEKLRQIVEQSKARSAVFDIITNQVPVEIGVNVG